VAHIRIGDLRRPLRTATTRPAALGADVTAVLHAAPATFPDAVAVLTHRDPVAVVQSIASRFACGHRLRHAEVDTGAILERGTALVAEMLRARMADAALIPVVADIR
jgi:chemotaxis response regulator CheB